ncbi:hypothetical protein BDV06DRAFT_206051 [Aspergillus oleicola]
MTQDAEKKKAIMNNHIPLSMGPRVHIGRNIAYFAQLVVIATIVNFYDFTFEEGLIRIRELVGWG